jgi:hypothetical protein
VLTMPAQSPCGAMDTRITTISSAFSDSACALSLWANSIVALHSWMAVGPTITTMRSSSPRVAFASAVRVALTVLYTSASAGASSIRHAEGTRGRMACATLWAR